jgi:hypothetical protein
MKNNPSDNARGKRQNKFGAYINAQIDTLIKFNYAWVVLGLAAFFFAALGKITVFLPEWLRTTAADIFALATQWASFFSLLLLVPVVLLQDRLSGSALSKTQGNLKEQIDGIGEFLKKEIQQSAKDTLKEFSDPRMCIERILHLVEEDEYESEELNSAQVKIYYISEYLSLLGFLSVEYRERDTFYRKIFALRQKMGDRLNVYLSGYDINDDITEKFIDYKKDDIPSFFGSQFNVKNDDLNREAVIGKIKEIYLNECNYARDRFGVNIINRISRGQPKEWDCSFLLKVTFDKTPSEVSSEPTKPSNYEALIFYREDENSFSPDAIGQFVATTNQVLGEILYRKAESRINPLANTQMKIGTVDMDG